MPGKSTACCFVHMMLSSNGTLSGEALQQLAKTDKKCRSWTTFVTMGANFGERKRGDGPRRNASSFAKAAGTAARGACVTTALFGACLRAIALKSKPCRWRGRKQGGADSFERMQGLLARFSGLLFAPGFSRGAASPIFPC